MPPLSLPQTLLVFAAQCLVLSGAGVAAQIWRRRLTARGSTATGAILLGALAPVVIGYLAFWLYFAHPLAGKFFSWLSLAAILGTLAHAYLLPRLLSPSPLLSVSPSPRLHHRLLALTFLAGSFYISALYVYPGIKFTDTACQRFIARMPGDNEIPRIFAERLFIGMSPKGPGGDWLSSDRPPLQTGLALVAMPAFRAAGVDIDIACATAGVWFQLLWIPALWCFLRWLGVTEREAHAGAAALVFTGFLLFNSIFTWPKLGGAALVLLAFCTFFRDASSSPHDLRRRFALGGALAGFGALAHGGVMFSLLALAPFALLKLRQRWTAWLCAGAVFASLALPWMAYQRFYEPPGTRLVKWHIGGVIPPDARSVSTALRDSYRELGWKKAWETRRQNFSMLFHGEWKNLLSPTTARAYDRRVQEAAYPLRAIGGWALALGAVGWLAWFAKKTRRNLRPWRDRGTAHLLALGWLALTLVIWVSLMFFPNSVLVHQGSLVTQLLALGLLCASALLAGRWFFGALAVVEIFLFAFTWLAPSPAVATIPPHLPAILTAACAALAVIALGWSSLWRPLLSPAKIFLARRAALLAWRPAPRHTWWAVAAAYLLLIAHKPWALTAPQLWAEDGSVHLADNDRFGAGAFLLPYRGYLHLLPRLIAWLASRTTDVAHWPAFYNGAALLVAVALFVRFASPRLDLPGKPWLILAFVLAANTGEVFLNITNLHWLTAFFLLQQTLIARPTTPAQRIGDLAILGVIGLTGPFVLVFLPLFAWRWWRERHADTLAVLLVALACAATQAWFIKTTGPHFAPQSQPIHLAMLLAVAGSRLVVWPLFGSTAASTLPLVALGAIGAVFIAALALWALRPHPRRLLRAQILVAFALITPATLYRIRPDTWESPNLVNGDSYFFIARILLAWLLIWELDARPRAVAFVARGLYLVAVLFELPHHREPAPPDYHWAERCDAIRRGVPANIPTLPEGWIFEYPGRPTPK